MIQSAMLYPPTMSEGVDEQELGQLVRLLELAHSNDNSAQSEVYQALKAIEERPASYFYLAFLFASDAFALPLRRMAGLTLSSFLKRNKNVVHFEPGQIAQIKSLLMRVSAGELARVRSMAISELISRNNFDFELFGELIAGIDGNRENVGMANIILEDIRFNNENYNVFEDQRFWQLTEMIYQRLLALLRIEVADLKGGLHILDYIKCINLLTFHCPNRLYPYLAAYLESVIKPLLLLSASQPLPVDLLELCLQGVNEIVATKFSLISREVLEMVVRYSPAVASSEVLKCWSNIMIDMIENESEENNSFQQYLPLILPRAIDGLTFTHQDERNIKEEMEVEYNPYGEGEGENIDQEEEAEAEILEASYGGTSGYTLRKLSFQLIDKISIHYSEGLWSQWANFIGQRLRSDNPAITETAISFLGIIAETCMHDMGEDLHHSLLFLIDTASPRHCALLRATSLWALEKLLPAFKDSDEVVSRCLGLVFEGVRTSSEGTHTTHLMLKEAAISLLDEILSLESIGRVASPQAIDQIVETLLHGLAVFKGRALFSVFKALSTIFESEHFRNTLPEVSCERVVGELCRKWGVSTKSDSIMCPLLECLITAYEGLRKYLSKFNAEFFAQLLPLLRCSQRKQLVLRSIDFLSALVTAAHPNLLPCVTAPDFLELVSSLATSEEKEIRHFAYILISDIGKNYGISVHAEKFVLLVAQTMDSKSLTSRNNALMCLTDLLERYPALTTQYLPQVAAKVVDVVNKEELASVYAFNFARMLGRLWLLDGHEGRRQLLLCPSLLHFAFLSLRTREVTRLTSDSFRGLLQVIDSFTVQELQLVYRDLECVLEALVCYPVRREESVENQAVVGVFAQSVRLLRAKLGEQLWGEILRRPIFLPAALRTLSAWSS